MPKQRRRSEVHTEEILAALDHARQETPDHRTRALLHELQLHAEIITAQNDELKKTQAELEEATSRYADLYDLAPIGFLALSKSGLILDINIAGATLLGINRPFARGLPIFAAVQRQQRRRLRELLRTCWQRGQSVTTTFDLATKQHPLRLLRFTSRLQGGSMATRLFTAIVDVTEENRLEAEHAAALERELARGQELTREVAERRRAEERVKSLLERVVHVQEEERRRIARNLHDHLGQQMTALRLTVAALKGARSPDEVRDRLELLDSLATKIDRDLDTIAWDLRPAALDDVGLNAALATLINEWSASHGVPAEFHVSEPHAIRLTTEVESHLYRVVQEALHNITKHAGATHVSVMVERRDNHVIVIVEDNGRGFNLEAQADDKSAARGMGLIGMQERAALVGGRVQIESALGKGTTLFVHMPVHPAIHRLVARKRANSDRK